MSKHPNALDLSRLDEFNPFDLVANPSKSDIDVPKTVALNRIDFDAEQPRQSLAQVTLEELAESIRQQGVLEPVALRTVAGTDRLIVNRGERRVRAARLAGLTHIPAFLDSNIDPYAQVAENLHREDMSPFDIARFVDKRIQLGESRGQIAAKLGRDKSFVTRALAIVDPPTEVQEAYSSGRVTGMRSLYEMVIAGKGDVKAAAEMPSPEMSVGGVVPSVVEGVARQDKAVGSTKPIVRRGKTALLVSVSDRVGSLRLKAMDSDVGEVVFGDGAVEKHPLRGLRLVGWALE